MKKKIIIISVIVIAAIIVGIVKYHSQSSLTQTNAVWVKAAVVQESTLPITVRAIGSLVARSVAISPEIPGHVSKVNFIDGSLVKKGDVLIQLDDALYKAKYDSAKAKLAYSQNDYKRKNLLAKRGVISQQAIDQALADLKEMQANADESAVMVSKMQMQVPFDGVVGKSKVNLGDYVLTGQNIVVLTDTKHLRIEYTIPERFLPLLKLGQKVNIVSSTYPDKTFLGKVSFISPTINAESRSVSIYADIVNDSNELAPGMFVNVKQSLGKQEKVIMIPGRSLVPILDGEQVYKIVEGKAYGVSVMIGKRKDDNVQIIQGLKAGDTIITDGQLKVRNGFPIQIKN